MNFSVKKYNDASVFVVLECETISFKGLVLYALPFLGENDDEDIGKLVAEHPTVKPEDHDEQKYGPLADYHVIFNLTPYSEAVVRTLISAGRRTRSGVLVTACVKDVTTYLINNITEVKYEILPGTDQLRDMFETIEPLKMAKYAALMRSAL